MRPSKAWPAAILTLLAAWYASLLTSRVALSWDEGLYLVLGKALAAGQGYRVISAPDLPFEAGHPPLYPALLALGWWLDPRFPQNLWLLKLPGVGLGVATVAASYALALRAGGSRAKALATGALVATSGSLLVFLDVTMSELLYMAASLAALAAVERLGTRLPAWRLAALGLGLALPALVRSVGVTVGLGAVAWLAWHRRWRELAIVTPVLLLVQAPWHLWGWWLGHRHLPVNFDYGTWLEQAGGPDKLATFAAAAGQHVGELASTGLVVLLAPGYPAIAHARHLGAVAPALWALVTLTFLLGVVTTLRRGASPFHWYLLAYCAVILPFPWPPMRYAGALAPLLLYLLVEGAWRWLPADTAAPWRRAVGRGLACAVLLVSGGWGGEQLARRLADRQAPAIASAPVVEAGEGVAAIARLTPPTAVLLCQTRLADTNEFRTYLLSGRQALGWRYSFTAAVGAPRRLALALARMGPAPGYVLTTARPDDPDRGALAGWRQLWVSPGANTALFGPPGPQAPGAAGR